MVGVALIALSVFFYRFFGGIDRENFDIITTLVTFLLFIGPLLASGIALGREGLFQAFPHFEVEDPETQPENRVELLACRGEPRAVPALLKAERRHVGQRRQHTTRGNGSQSHSLSIAAASTSKRSAANATW